MRCCIAKGCRTRAGSQNGKSMFHMPAVGSVNCRIWLEKLDVSKADFLKTKAHKRFVCSDHFDEDSFEINYERELLGTSKPKILKPNATPLQQPVVPVVKRKNGGRKPLDQRTKLKTLQPQKKDNILLSLEERVEIVLLCGRQGWTQRQVAKEFSSSHPGRKSVSQSAVSKLVKKFKETGSFADKPRSGRPSVSEDVREIILAKVHANPAKSIRCTAMELGLPKSTVHKVLSKEKFHRGDGVKECLRQLDIAVSDMARK